MNKSKRDELAEKADTMDYSHCSDSGIVIGFRKGYSAGYAEAQAQAKVLVEALNSCKAAMSYAYEDRVDMYYLNVATEIDKALEQYKKVCDG